MFVGPDTAAFRIARSRSLTVLAQQLDIDTDAAAAAGALPEGRQALLSSDFYSVYRSLGRLDGVENLWCWAHIRRRFVRAGDTHPELRSWATGWIERIAALYAAHTALAAAPQTSQHTMAAAQFSAALNTIDAQRTTQQSHLELLHPAAAKVLANRGVELGDVGAQRVDAGEHLVNRPRRFAWYGC